MANMDDLALLRAVGALEEVEQDVAEHWPQRRTPHGDAFDLLSETKFKKIYRLTKPLVRELINTLEPQLIPPSRATALSVEDKVLAALKFYGGGSYQTDVGLNFYNGMSQPSVSRCVEEVTQAINQIMFGAKINMPRNLEELLHVRRGFHQKFNFPGVVGLIDCTHVAIVPPRRDIEHMYVNRKLYHSINTQLICDYNLKIMHVCARYPGSTHDSFIWQNSSSHNYMEQLHNRGRTDFFLLGDSGYPLRTFLMTPVENAEAGSPEERYNVAQRGCRSTVERCNGVLKMRFRCLLKHRMLHYTPEKACHIIKACCVLHNLCIEHNVPLPENEEDVDEEDLGVFNQIPDNRHGGILNNPRMNALLLAGRQLRARLIRDRFA